MGVSGAGRHPGNQGLVAADVKGMAGLAIFGGAQAPEAPAGGGQNAGHCCNAIRPGIHTPGTDDVRVLPGNRLEAPIVVRADRVWMLPELGRVHCAQGVEVRHGNAVAAPGPGEGAAAADGRVVLGGVRRARVEHQEEGSVLLGVHVAWPGEQVAVGSAFAEDRAHDCIVVVVRWCCGRGKNDEPRRSCRTVAVRRDSGQ
ncbi:hypothetical protein FQZ97_729180 [compost metagenome]